MSKKRLNHTRRLKVRKAHRRARRAVIRSLVRETAQVTGLTEQAVKAVFNLAPNRKRELLAESMQRQASKLDPNCNREATAKS